MAVKKVVWSRSISSSRASSKKWHHQSIQIARHFLMNHLRHSLSKTPEFSELHLMWHLQRINQRLKLNSLISVALDNCALPLSITKVKSRQNLLLTKSRDVARCRNKKLSSIWWRNQSKIATVCKHQQQNIVWNPLKTHTLTLIYSLCAAIVLLNRTFPSRVRRLRFSNLLLSSTRRRKMRGKRIGRHVTRHHLDRPRMQQ